MTKRETDPSSILLAAHNLTPPPQILGDQEQIR